MKNFYARVTRNPYEEKCIELIIQEDGDNLRAELLTLDAAAKLITDLRKALEESKKGNTR